MTIHAWLTANSPGYRCHDVHPFSIGVVPAEVALCDDLTDKQKKAHEEFIHPGEWAERIVDRGDIVRIYKLPRGLIRSRSPRHCSKASVRISDAHATVARHAHKPGAGASL